MWAALHRQGRAERHTEELVAAAETGGGHHAEAKVGYTCAPHAGGFRRGLHAEGTPGCAEQADARHVTP
eukprot:scaffold3161_cov118-Isochrysis_galbana.AAC.15